MDLKDGAPVAQLCAYLLHKFPGRDAEPWDNVGLLQGDGAAPVNGIAIALNATPETVISAAHAGCNVLVTHHPAFLGKRPQLSFRDTNALDVSLGAATLAKAHKLGISLIALHTNLDVSDEAVRLPAKLTGYEYLDRLTQPAQQKSSYQTKPVCYLQTALKAFARKTYEGFAKVLTPDSSRPSSRSSLPSSLSSSFKPLFNYFYDRSCLRGSYGGILNTRSDSADKIAQVFATSYHCHAEILSTDAQNLNKYLPHKVAFCSGSLDGSLGRVALKRGIDLIVCGEVHYHTALELVLAGATLIELGHDASEEPYAMLLDEVITQALPHDKIVRIEASPLLVSVE